MCGILVVTNSKLPPDELRSRTLRAQASLRHRGPDHSGTEIIVTPEGNHAVCHERLAIVDPSSSGNQPFLEGGTSARAALAANAEIYNHEALRTRLGPQAPAGGSDCAALLPLWRELGDATAKELDGDFAFALVAKKNEENGRADVYCARDPVGVDSLYIGYGGADDPTAVCFASEAKALIDTGLCERVEPFPPGHFYTNKVRLREISDFEFELCFVLLLLRTTHSAATHPLFAAASRLDRRRSRRRTSFGRASWPPRTRTAGGSSATGHRSGSRAASRSLRPMTRPRHSRSSRCAPSSSSRCASG